MTSTPGYSGRPVWDRTRLAGARGGSAWLGSPGWRSALRVRLRAMLASLTPRRGRGVSHRGLETDWDAAWR
jgi:hypothetical protein